jgi:hypothetical protein
MNFTYLPPQSFIITFHHASNGRYIATLAIPFDKCEKKSPIDIALRKTPKYIQKKVKNGKIKVRCSAHI